jgi:hypothetical protein
MKKTVNVCDVTAKQRALNENDGILKDGQQAAAARYWSMSALAGTRLEDGGA